MTVVQAQQVATATAAAAKEIPRGKPVSGRPWKTVQKTRFSTAKYTGTAKLSTTWEDKVAKKARAKELKALQGEIKARRQAERDAKRQAREDKEKRRKENELKSAAVQVVRRALVVVLVLVPVREGTHARLNWLADLADTPHQGHEQEAAAQHQEDHRQQAGRRRVCAALLQVGRRDRPRMAAATRSQVYRRTSFVFPCRSSLIAALCRPHATASGAAEHAGASNATARWKAPGAFGLFSAALGRILGACASPWAVAELVASSEAPPTHRNGGRTPGSAALLRPIGAKPPCLPCSTDAHSHA